MLPPRFPVLSALLLLLLLRGSGPRTDGRGAMEPAAGHSGQRAKSPERGSRPHHGAEAQLRDPRHKEKLIRHLTGPLYFTPKCRKHFHRLYHNSRDCTTPAYYKRCARLLTRLAGSPHCTER